MLPNLPRVLYLSRTYGTLKRYAEALSLTSKAHIYLRESSSILSTSSAPKDEEKYYSLTPTDVSNAEVELSKEEVKMKTDWYAFNGGKAIPSPDSGKKKPMFYDVAFNYVELPMDKLLARSSNAKPAAPAPAPVAKATTSQAKPMALQTSTGATAKEKRATKVEEAPPPVPEPKIVQSGGYGLGGILGGWWGKK